MPTPDEVTSLLAERGRPVPGTGASGANAQLATEGAAL
jgi:5-dehydro-2-deoxygluconokinase